MPPFESGVVGKFRAVSKPGLRYRLDRTAQGFAPQRKLDAFGLRHPLVDKLAYVVLAAFFAVLIAADGHSILLGVVAGLLIATVAAVVARRNHKRRVANGTSAVYGPPK
jgi:Flp pilus assembly protein TadB